MSSGRWAKRGWAFQGRADAGWALAGQGGAVFTGYVFSPSRRLVGSRLLTRLEGTAATAIQLTGTDTRTRTIEGPAK